MQQWTGNWLQQIQLEASDEIHHIKLKVNGCSIIVQQMVGKLHTFIQAMTISQTVAETRSATNQQTAVKKSVRT